MEEIWKEVPEWEGRYEISNLGRIRGCRGKNGKYIEEPEKRKVLKQFIRRGYKFVVLEESGVRKKNTNIHRCVMLTFNPIEDMDSYVVNHIDGNKMNNVLSNLEWVTCKENIKHYWDNKDKIDTFKERRANSNSCLSITYKGIEYDSLCSFSKAIGVCTTTARRRLKKFEDLENPLVFIIPNDCEI